MLISSTHCINSGLKLSELVVLMSVGRESRVEEAVGAGQRHRFCVDEAEFEFDADGWALVAMEFDFRP